jgi:hypothetical protein
MPCRAIRQWKRLAVSSAGVAWHGMQLTSGSAGPGPLLPASAARGAIVLASLAAP